MDFESPKKDRRFKDGDMKSAIDELETGPTETTFRKMLADLDNEVKSSASPPGKEPADHKEMGKSDSQDNRENDKDSGQTLEELQLRQALSLQGMCPKTMEAFRKMLADLDNEVKSSASPPGNEPANHEEIGKSDSQDNRENDKVVAAPAPRPPLLKKLRGLNKVHPLVEMTPPKKGSNAVAPPRKLPPLLPSLPGQTKIQHVLPRALPDITWSYTGKYQTKAKSEEGKKHQGMEASVNAMASSAGALNTSNPQNSPLCKFPHPPKEPKSKLPLYTRPLKKAGAPKQHCSLPPLARSGPGQESHSMPLPKKKKSLFGRTKQKSKSQSNERNSSLPLLTRPGVVQESHSMPQTKEKKSIFPCLLGRRTKPKRENLSKDQNSTLPPVVNAGTEQTTEVIQETKSITLETQAPRPPTAEHKTGFFRLRRFFSSKVTPFATLMEDDEVSLGTPSEPEQKVFFPFAQPHSAMDQAFKLLRSDNWENRMEGLNSFRRLAQFHPNVLAPKLHSICLLVVQEVQNLQSQVSRVAVATLGELYLHLGHAMDPELGWTAKALLQKSGESSRFIREQVDVALRNMRHHCTPSLVLKALLNKDLSDHDVAVRECVARHMKALFKRMGTAHLLRCRKADIDSFLSAICRMRQDTSHEVRSCGKKIIGVLAANKELSKKMSKILPLHLHPTGLCFFLLENETNNKQ